VALAALLRLAGFNVSLCLIHDEELYHSFVVRDDGMGYGGTLISLDRYAEAGRCWFILDPSYGHDFLGTPTWTERYTAEDGTVKLPADLCHIVFRSVDEFDKVAREIVDPQVLDAIRYTGR